MIGYKLTTKQSMQLVGKLFNGNSLFNPVPDIEGVYFIFEGEVDRCVNPEFMWVKELPTAEYVPPIVEQP